MSPSPLDDQVHDLYLARLPRLRLFMRKANLPVLLTLDVNHIFYATGARNMQVFGMLSPSRYLLVFADGPTVLYEYAGGEHLAQHLPTVTHIKPAIGLSFLGSGGATGRCEPPLRAGDRIHHPYHRPHH